MAFNGEIIEIFSRLPAKALHRLRALCKSCAEFPLERYFVMKQSQHLRSKNASAFFIQPAYGWVYINDDVEFLRMHGNESSSCGIPARSLQFLKNIATILASNNGLLVCTNNSNSNHELEIFVCNPVTQTWQPIPSPEIFNEPPVCSVGVEICFDDDQLNFPDDYRLIILKPEIYHTSILDCYICYPKERTWKEMKIETECSRDHCFQTPVYCNGLLYVVSDSFPFHFYRPYIVCSDIENKSSRILKLPKNSPKGLGYQNNFVAFQNHYFLSIFRWGKMGGSFQSICLVRLTRNSVFTVWVLEDSRKSISWRRILKRRVGALALGINKSDAIVAGFTVMNGHSLLFATGDNKVYRYYLMDSNCLEAEEIGEHHQHGRDVLFNAYANTLRPCGSGVTFPM